MGNREYFLKVADFHATFTADSQEVVVRHDGFEQVGKRIDAAAAKAAEDFPRRRLAENVPLPGSEATIHRVLDELRGSPDYGRMTPMLARAVRENLPSIQEELNSLGRVLSVEFIGVGDRGVDVYLVHGMNAEAEWRTRLTEGGTLEWLEHHPIKEAPRLPLANVGTLRTQPGGQLATLEFLNKTNAPLHLYWLNQEGGMLRRGSVEPHRLRTLPCYASEVFMLGRDESHPVAIFRAAPGWSLGTGN